MNEHAMTQKMAVWSILKLSSYPFLCQPCDTHHDICKLRGLLVSQVIPICDACYSLLILCGVQTANGPYLMYLILTGWNTFVCIAVFVPSLDIYTSVFSLLGMGMEAFIYHSSAAHLCESNIVCVSWKGCATGQQISCWHHSVEAWVEPQASPGGNFGGWSGLGTGFSPSILILLHQYHFTNAPYSFSHHWHYIVIAVDSIIMWHTLY